MDVNTDVTIDSSVVTEVPLWWKMMIKKEVTHCGNKKHMKISAPFSEICCETKPSLKKSLNLKKYIVIGVFTLHG